MSYRKNVWMFCCLAACLAANFLIAPVLLGASNGSAVVIQPLATATPIPTQVPHTSTGDLAYPVKSPFISLTFHGNTHLPEVALTFDDGPFPVYTAAILGILRQYGVHATFFELGAWVKRYGDISKAIIADGHVIGDHSWSHPDLSKMNVAQIQQQLANTITQIQQATGERPVFFRPPYGAYDRRVLDVAASLKLSTIIWDIDPRDWSRPGTGAIISNVLGHLHNGAIILLHDGGGNRSQTVQALPTIIEQVRARGYRFVTIPQMLAHLEPGKSSNSLLVAPLAPASALVGPSALVFYGAFFAHVRPLLGRRAFTAL